MDEDRDRILELLWQNGPVTQSQRSIKKSTPSDLGADLIPDDQSTRHHGRPESLFVQEDEMASWLHYPLNDTAFPSEFCSDLLFSSPPCVNAAETTAAIPITITNASTSASALEAPAAPIPPSLRIDNFGHLSVLSRRFDESGPSNSNRSVKESAVPITITNASTSASALEAPAAPIPPSLRIDNFGHLSVLSRRFDESGPSNSNRSVKESTVLDSSATPAVPPQLRIPDVRERLPRGITSVAASVTVPAASSAGLGSEAPACDASVTSSLGGSTESADPPTPRAVPIALPEDRKRKGQEPDCDDGDCHSEDDELGDKKKPLRCSSSSTRKSRAAEVHNLSERKRRDRINERMKTLQELIPNCNKADKASMLDEAIEYLKSLQLQLQMISMGGCSSMVPTMMFPAPQVVPHQQQQHYIIPQQHIGGMGMGLGINHPMMMMMPFPNNNVLNAAAAAAAAAAGSVGVAQHMMNPRFPMQPPMFHNMQQQQQQNVAVAGGGGGVAGSAAARFPFPQPGGVSYHDPTMLSSSSSNSNPAVINPNMADPLYHHHQYLSALHHLQIPPHPNQEMQHSRSKLKASENLERQPKG